MNRLSFFFVLALLASSVAAAAEHDARPAPSQNNGGAREEAQPPAASDSQPLTDAKLPEFATLDVDRDASISREEARGHAGLTALFNECDVDRDGRLSTWEFAEARQKLVAQNRPEGHT